MYTVIGLKFMIINGLEWTEEQERQYKEWLNENPESDPEKGYDD